MQSEAQELRRDHIPAMDEAGVDVWMNNVETSTADHIHFNRSLGSCNADMMRSIYF